MNQIDIDKAFISEYDTFLFTFDAHHSKTDSQLKEISKHQKLAQIRDKKSTDANQNEIWQDF